MSKKKFEVLKNVTINGYPDIPGLLVVPLFKGEVYEWFRKNDTDSTVTRNRGSQSASTVELEEQLKKGTIKLI